MATDINSSIQTASLLPNSITSYIQRLLKQGPDFSNADRGFQQGFAHPSLMTGPGGSWVDPMQANTVNSTNLLGERSNIAGQDIQNKMGLAQDLTQSASVFANMQNAIPFLNAMNLKGGGSSSIFGSLGF